MKNTTLMQKKRHLLPCSLVLVAFYHEQVAQLPTP